MFQLFSAEELELISRDAGIRFDALTAGSLELKIENLIVLCERADSIHNLMHLCGERRPNIDWVSLVVYQTAEPIRIGTNGVELKPFGEVACEQDIDMLKGKYSDYYFTETPFTQLALGRQCFLIIGRRGSGKTALSEYFKFQTSLPHAITVDIHEPSTFELMLSQANSLNGPKEIVIPKLATLWERQIWHAIFEKLKHRDRKIAQVCPGQSPSQSILGAVSALPALVTNGSNNTVNAFSEAKEAVCAIALREPVVLIIDTLESVAFDNEGMLRCVSALIECASAFNRAYGNKNIHLKVFVMAEAFPHLKEEVILNPLKSLHGEVYMHWRPRDLLRLIAWRFYHYQRAYGYLRPEPVINWSSYSDVLAKMWHPFFGQEIVNGAGLEEPTFPYLLRHTQMRPRQLIYLCNTIATHAQQSGHFPMFSATNLIEGVREAEVSLADEVISSYDAVYHKAAKILDALGGIPTIFQARELDKRAPLTARLWERGNYSPANFLQLVSELGIVGRIRHKDDAQGVITADFEYFSKGRLGLLSSDECVIHPMFYAKFRVTKVGRYRVYPFPKSVYEEMLSPSH
jgi:hypothetical protein